MILFLAVLKEYWRHALYMYFPAKNGRPRAHVPETSFSHYDPPGNPKNQPPMEEEPVPPAAGDALGENIAKEDTAIEEEDGG